MEIFKIAVVGIVTAICVSIVKEHRPDVAILVGIAGGIMILLSLIDYLKQTFAFLAELSEKSGMDKGVLKTLIKVVLIGYVTDFAAGVVEESGAKALSEKVVLGGKLLIFAVSLPVIRLLIEIVEAMLL